MILYVYIDIKYSIQLYSQNRTFDSVTFVFYKLYTSEVFESFFLLLFHIFLHNGMDCFYNLSLKTSERVVWEENK